MLLRRGDADLPPVFVCHDVVGDVVGLLPLARLLPGSRPVHGVEPRLDHDGAALDHTVEAMAAWVVEVVQRSQPSGPYSLMGYSFGANVALEVAHQLEVLGERVAHLVLLDPYVSDRCLRPVERWTYRLLRRPLGLLAWLLNAGAERRRRVARRLLGALRPGPRPVGTTRWPTMPEQSEYVAARSATAYSAFEAHRPQPLRSTPVLVLRCAVRFVHWCDPLPVLRRVVPPPRLRLVAMAGNHFDLVRDPGVQRTARVVGAWLEV